MTDENKTEEAVEKVENTVEPEETAVEKKVEDHIPGTVEMDVDVRMEDYKDTEHLDLSNVYPSDIEEVFEKTNDLDISDSEKNRKWAESIIKSQTSLPALDMLRSCLEDEDARFKQRPMHNGKPLVGSVPKMSQVSGKTLSGEAAALRMMSSLNLSDVFQAPLWHSGFWITLKPASESEYVDLNRRLISTKNELGRETYGLIFSGIVSYANRIAVDFVLDHVISTTIEKSVSKEELRELISIQDIDILLWAMACTRYTKGFTYTIPCLNDIENCQEVFTGNMNIKHLMFTNDAVLSDWQKEHMSYRDKNSRTLEQISRYKEELSNLSSKRIVINESNHTYITLKSPSIKEYTDAGAKWLQEILTHVEKDISEDLPSNQRENLLATHANSTRLRYYGHWVENIEFEGNNIEERDSISTVLNFMSSNEDFYEKIMDEVYNYINETVFSVVGIPVFTCPSCGLTQDQGTYPKQVSARPLNMLTVFFSLTIQLQERIANR